MRSLQVLATLYAIAELNRYESKPRMVEYHPEEGLQNILAQAGVF